MLFLKAPHYSSVINYKMILDMPKPLVGVLRLLKWAFVLEVWGLGLADLWLFGLGSLG